MDLFPGVTEIQGEPIETLPTRSTDATRGLAAVGARAAMAFSSLGHVHSPWRGDVGV